LIFPHPQVLRRIVSGHLCAFLFLNILFAQEIDSSIIISDFQYPYLHGIPIILDETGENTFYLNERNPEFISDGKINQVMLDGALGIPLGSYFLPKILPKSSQADSVKNTSQIYYRKGYAYNDLGIGLQIELSDSGLFSFQGFKRSPPQIYQSSSDKNQFQNHLFSYSKDSENSNVAVSTLYHIENYNLPDYQENINRQVESFHGGLWIEQSWGELTLNIQPAFQFSHINHGNTEANNLTVWNALNSEYHLWGNISLLFDYNAKMITTENDNQTTETSSQIFSPAIRYKNDTRSFQVGITYLGRSITPVGMLSWRFNNLYLSVERNYNFVFTSIPNYETELVQYSTNAFSIGYVHKQIRGNLEIFQTQTDFSYCKYKPYSRLIINPVINDADMYLGVIGKVELDLFWLRLTQSFGIYNLGESNSQPLDMYSHTTLIYSPNVWRWRNLRYQPFIGAEAIHMHHPSILGIDLSHPVYHSPNAALVPFSSYLLNMEIGLLVSRFKASYRLANINILNSLGPYPILLIGHLEVVWQFWN